MPVSFYYTPDGLGIVSRYTGEVVDDDMMAACEFRINHISRMADIRYNIADIRAATAVNLTSSGIMDVARKARECVMPHVVDLLYIAVVDRHDQYGTMRMWMTLSDHDNINNQIAKSDEDVKKLINSHLKLHNIDANISWPES